MAMRRGRPSAEALAAAQRAAEERLNIAYAEPPAYLSAQEQEFWRTIIRTKPPEWFDAASYPLLESYCVDITQQRRLALELRKLTPGTEQFTETMRLHDALVRTLAQLATKMRLAQQSRYDDNKAGRHANPAMPNAEPWGDV